MTLYCWITSLMSTGIDTFTTEILDDQNHNVAGLYCQQDGASPHYGVVVR